MNKNHPSVRRILREVKELQQEGSWQLAAAPLDDNIYEWHFTIRGPCDTAFDGGIYHGRILLPQDYPFKPPNFVLLTPNGRFEVGKKICLSISAHHPETWRPSWSIRTALVALIGFFPTEGNGAIGAIDYPEKERKKLAAESISWSCSSCGVHNGSALPPRPSDGEEGSADVRDETNIDVSEIQISKIVPVEEDTEKKDPAVEQVEEEEEQEEEQQEEKASQASGAARTKAAAAAVAGATTTETAAPPPPSSFSAGSLLIYFLLTCILALVVRKLMA
eukprot:TRINITY_DN954_c0_g1_i1.p1 TRINITY_DN954_c0_g1~~TRINITY_DN954_c0_g1_i1.p1  ORF type:complete len:277 (+),score=72.10 TRINITY_DN954_c0_g1_i1:82-912(+)